MGFDLGYSRVSTTSERLDHQLDGRGVGVSPRRPRRVIPSVITLLIDRLRNTGRGHHFRDIGRQGPPLLFASMTASCALP